MIFLLLHDYQMNIFFKFENVTQENLIEDFKWW